MPPPIPAIEWAAGVIWHCQARDRHQIMSLRSLTVGASPLRSIARGLAIAALLWVGSRTVLTPLWASGISMAPTIADGELLLVNRVAYRLSAPARGDIVAIRLAGGAAALVKRVVALPGERVRIVAGTVLIDDQPLDEPYVERRTPWDVPEATMGINEYFVIGDNRAMPARNHDFGSTHASRIMGRLWR